MAQNTIDQASLPTKLFIGIEGGASISKGILFDETGKELSTVSDAPSTNFWIVGLEVAYSRIHVIVNELKKRANLREQIMIDSLGCCLSGVKDGEVDQPFADGFLSKYPNLVKNCISRNDTIGSIFTTSTEGGLALIAGTGSNCYLHNPNGLSKNCGGWGHMLGDEGSGYKLVSRAIKTIINEEDGLKKSLYDIENVRRLIFSHFQIKKSIEILKFIYQEFDKQEFASACKKITALAKEGDQFARHLFYLNGRDLARHVNAVLPFVEQKLLGQTGGLRILCVGSLFKSWPLLQSGFLDTIDSGLKEFTLVSLRCSSSIGAAFLAAKSINHFLNVHTDRNIEEFFTFKR